MAERRMFAKTIIDSDAFLDMPVTARLLYYDLAMRADDDGFVNSPKKIMRMVGASQDDLTILAMKKFIIPFESGVVVIKHWKIHNYIRKDTYKETAYKDEKARLAFDENNSYTLQSNVLETPEITDVLIDRRRAVDEPSTQDRLGKDSIGYIKEKDKKEKKTAKRFTPPTVDEVKAYCQERKNSVDPNQFVDFYTAKGWKIGKDTMKDWKAAVRTWETRERKNGPSQKKPMVENRNYNFNDLEKKLTGR